MLDTLTTREKRELLMFLKEHMRISINNNDRFDQNGMTAFPMLEIKINDNWVPVPTVDLTYVEKQ